MRPKRATMTCKVIFLFGCCVGLLTATDRPTKTLSATSQGRSAGSDFAIEAGVLYCASDYDDRLYALRADTGEEVWSAPAPGGSTQVGPVAADGHLFLAGGGAFQTVYDLESSNGHLRWSANVRASILIPGPDKLFVNSEEPGTVIALDMTSGARAWSSTAYRDSHYVGALAYRSGMLFTDMEALDAFSGRKLWKWPKGLNVEKITFSGQYVIVGADNGEVSTFDAKSGLLRWRSAPTQKNRLGGVVAGQKAVFVVRYDDYPDEAHNGTLSALNLNNGKVLWRLPIASRTHALLSDPLALYNGKLYLLRPDDGTSTGDDIVALDTSTGHALWIYTSGRGLSGPPVAQDGLVYVSAAGEMWLAVEEGSGHLSWSFAAPTKSRVGGHR